jgi:hypothetical protein
MKIVAKGVLTVFSLLVCAPSAFGAYLYIDPSESTVYRGDTVTLAVRVDTDEGECINVIDASISYSNNIKAIDVSRGESILNVWVEDPVIDEVNKKVTFAGGIPGGYCGRIAGDPSLTNVIAELVFRSPGLSIGGGTEPVARLDFDAETQVLLHDGFGTPAELRMSGADVLLDSKIGSQVSDDWNGRIQDDAIPPSDFNIVLTKDTEAFNRQYYIVFNSVDKQSGIDRYEVMEEPFEEFNLFKWGAADAPWVRTQSPYVLKDQSLNSTIRVRAIDKAGNETVAVLVPDEAIRTMSTERMIVTTVLAAVTAIIAGLIFYALWRRKRELDAEYEIKEQQQTYDPENK